MIYKLGDEFFAPPEACKTEGTATVVALSKGKYVLKIVPTGHTEASSTVELTHDELMNQGYVKK